MGAKTSAGQIFNSYGAITKAPAQAPAAKTPAPTPAAKTPAPAPDLAGKYAATVAAAQAKAPAPTAKAPAPAPAPAAKTSAVPFITPQPALSQFGGVEAVARNSPTPPPPPPPTPAPAREKIVVPVGYGQHRAVLGKSTNPEGTETPYEYARRTGKEYQRTAKDPMTPYEYARSTGKSLTNPAGASAYDTYLRDFGWNF